MAILKVWDNDNSDWLVPTNNATDNILLRVYPVGSIYMSVNNIDPGTLFGGTWVAWGSGRVPVGVDTGQSEFSPVEKTGGHKAMQAHAHVYFANIPHSDGQVVTTEYINAPLGYGTARRRYQDSTNIYGAGDSQNLQPYITCYMWKRTA